MEGDLDGVKTYADFQVIEILEDKDPCPTLLGIYLDFDNDAIKQWRMSFEGDGHQVVQSLDPTLGEHFVEPVEDVMDESALDQLYNLTVGKREDYINPTTDGE